MPRKSPPVTCSKSDIIQLQNMAASGDSRLAQKARMILMCIRGIPVKDIAAELHERPNTVILWRNRFSSDGIKGLDNRPRGNPGNLYGSDLVDRIRKKLAQDPPDGHDSWTGKLLADELSVPLDAIWRHLYKEGFRLKDLKAETACTPQTYPITITEEITIPLTITVRKEIEMSKADNSSNNASSKMDVEIIMKVKGPDGTIIEKTVCIPQAVPSIDDFDLGTREGLLRDFDEYEKAVIKARDEVLAQTTAEYLKQAADKKKRK